MIQKTFFFFLDFCSSKVDNLHDGRFTLTSLNDCCDCLYSPTDKLVYEILLCSVFVFVLSQCD